ncbi:hypothetical protein LTR08_000241 [Meristemomyces frigidus]|nr:hypothetical protein LTR08_000241 [Meristemomyces frigidus]
MFYPHLSQDSSSMEACHEDECVTKAPRRSLISQLKARMKGPASTIPGLADQDDSRLFSLPLELRELIWELVLAPPPNAKPAHFHIYDDIWDSCTYEPQDLEARMHSPRKAGLRSALLRTCSAIYSEAAQELYNNVQFELVLMAGHVRPDCVHDSEYGPGFHNNIEHRNRLGKLDQSILTFPRIRLATIVVQPCTAIPRVAAYTKRISKLLKALDYGSRTTQLTIKFNFADDTNVASVVAPIAKAFLPLADHGVAARRQLKLVHYVPIHTTPDYDDAVAILHVALWPSGARTAVPTARDPRSTMSRVGSCAVRGAHGKRTADPLVTRGEKACYVALVVGTLPLFWPLWVRAYVRRKKAKGERWECFSIGR